MDHKEIEWVGMDRISLAQDKNKWLTLVESGNNLQMAVNFSNS
jgi:hypothetical protein